MAKRKKERIGVISSMDQFRFASNSMHYKMGQVARQGSGSWVSKKDYERKSVKRGFSDDPDYGRVTTCGDCTVDWVLPYPHEQG